MAISSVSVLLRPNLRSSLVRLPSSDRLACSSEHGLPHHSPAHFRLLLRSARCARLLRELGGWGMKFQSPSGHNESGNLCLFLPQRGRFLSSWKGRKWYKCKPDEFVPDLFGNPDSGIFTSHFCVGRSGAKAIPSEEHYDHLYKASLRASSSPQPLLLRPLSGFCFQDVGHMTWRIRQKRAL